MICSSYKNIIGDIEFYCASQIFTVRRVKGEIIRKASQNVIRSSRKPSITWVDKSNELLKKSMCKFVKGNNIKTNSDKLAITEKIIRDLNIEDIFFFCHLNNAHRLTSYQKY